ncbi:ROK family transcriptional regulator [Lentibacter sp.]|uniref:ROK family transcriptional regulator n=1 Tax=Lentibacter sp. TaxID=2024994 RepID=UPI003F6BD09E
MALFGTFMSLDAHTSSGSQKAPVGVEGAVRGSNQTGVRAYNERLVLSIIRQGGPMPKAAIARLTGLSAQTVSVIMRALEDDGLLTKGAPVRGKVGQPSVPMGLAADGAFFLGLKVGRRGSELLLSDFVGEVRAHRRKAHDHLTPENAVAFANETIRDFLAALPAASVARVAGLGIALPFRMWDWVNDAKPATAGLAAWRTRDIAAEIGAAWDFPVYLCNDASAACGAELVFGAQSRGQGTPRDFLYVYIGYFVGGGLVLDDMLYTGKSGNAAALGSVPIVTQSGARCQLVDVASLVTLEEMLHAAGHDSAGVWERQGDWTADAAVLEAWLDQAAQGLAQAIVASTCLIDFTSVLIDGSMPQEVREALVVRTQRALAAVAVPGVEHPEVGAGTIGFDAKALGAASLPLSDRFLVDRDAFLKG